MTNSWFRSWHGAPTDPKWLAIAQRTQTNAGTVSAVFWALMDHASQAEDRGDVSTFDIEAYAAFSGFDADIVAAIISALTDKGLINNNHLTAWEKRQPKREDGSAERAKAWRERNRTPPNAKEHRLDTDREDKKRKKDIRAVAKATRTPADEDFEKFWAVYPKRGTAANPKKPAREKFERLVKSGADSAVIIAAAQRFCAIERQAGRFGTEKVAMAVTWLNQHRHDDYRPPPTTSAQPQAPPGAPSDEILRRKYGQPSDVPSETATDEADRNGADNGGELRRSGTEIRPIIRAF